MRVCIGKHPTLNQQGLWVAKPGKTVTSTDPNDFLFDPTRYGSRLYLSGEWNGAMTFLYWTTSQRLFGYPPWAPGGQWRSYYGAMWEFRVTVPLSPRPAWSFHPNNLDWFDEQSFGYRQDLVTYSTLDDGSDLRWVDEYNPSTGIMTVQFRDTIYAIFAHAFDP